MHWGEVDGIMVAERSRLLEILYKTSFRIAEEPEFKLSSGRLSRYYVDSKQALSFPEARLLTAKLICELIGPDTFDAVGGLEIGAYPIATSVSDLVYSRTGATVRAFVIRKEPKTHGVRDLVAGYTQRGDRALIVDDVLTTGESTITAIRRAREAGLQISRAILMVDRDEGDGGKENIERHGVRCESLFTLADLLRRANADDSGKNQRFDTAGSLSRKSA